MPATLILGRERLAPAQILAHPPDALTQNERAALEFCQAWLRGAGEFSVSTSGSTGAPKSIRLTRRQMEASARATAQALRLDPGMRLLVCLPTHYIAGRMMLVRGLVLEAEIVVVEPASHPLRALDDRSPFDFAAFVPLQLQTILAAEADHLACFDGARALLVGGAPIDAALERETSRMRAPVYHTYGMTETATHIALRRLNGSAPEDWFRALPGVSLQQDERGCLAIRGPMTNDAWIQTNDVVERVGADGFRWLGRADNVINSGGIKVLVEQVEAEIAPLIAATDRRRETVARRYFVTGAPDARLGQIVTLVLEGTPESDEAQARLLREMRDALGPYRSPRSLLYAPLFDETPSGKIDRSRSLAHALPHAPGSITSGDAT